MIKGQESISETEKTILPPASPEIDMHSDSNIKIPASSEASSPIQSRPEPVEEKIGMWFTIVAIVRFYFLIIFIYFFKQINKMSVAMVRKLMVLDPLAFFKYTKHWIRALFRSRNANPADQPQKFFQHNSAIMVWLKMSHHHQYEKHQQIQEQIAKWYTPQRGRVISIRRLRHSPIVSC